VVVSHVSLRDFRSYAALELDVAPGLVLVTGANGVGKTNLLEAIHVGSQGFSPRTRAETRLIRFGETAARVALAGAEGGVPVATRVAFARREAKRIELNGAPLASTDELRSRLSVLAFVPDRLAVVKGSPIVRRSYFDRMLGRLSPAEAGLPSDYGRALAQRNEALRRVRASASTAAALAPWTERVAELGTSLATARSGVVELLAPAFSERAATLGLVDAELVYEREPLTVGALDARLQQDVARGATGLGPHLADVRIAAGGRELRSFGSQGEQRIAVLALVLAEADVTAARREAPPLLLLDDVMSELDESRRAALVDSLPPSAQTLVTATSAEALPRRATAPTQVLVVSPGEVRPG
jgi:DNA replication and repair protein RecF